MQINETNSFLRYEQHQQNLLETCIKICNIIFIIGIAINSLWFPVVFWKALFQNIAAMMVILIGWFCSRMSRRGHMRLGAHIYLATAIFLMVAVVPNVGKEFILNVALIITIFILISTFLESPKYAYIWGCISIALYVIALSLRIFGPFEDPGLGPLVVAGLYGFPVINFIAIALIGRGAALRLSDALNRSEAARKDLLRSNDSLTEALTTLESTNKQLEDELTKRKQTEKELKKAKEDAEAASRVKSELMANIGHEFITPLNHIVGFTELTLDEKFGNLNEEQREHLGHVYQSGKKLSSLIHEIQDYSKISEGKTSFNKRSFNLKQVLENSMNIFKEEAIKNGIQLYLRIDDIPDIIKLDKSKLNKILHNLLSNSIKFTPREVRFFYPQK